MLNKLPDDRLEAIVTVLPLSDILLLPIVVQFVHLGIWFVVPHPATAPPALVNISSKFTPAERILV